MFKKFISVRHFLHFILLFLMLAFVNKNQAMAADTFDGGFGYCDVDDITYANAVDDCSQHEDDESGCLAQSYDQDSTTDSDSDGTNNNDSDQTCIWTPTADPVSNPLNSSSQEHADQNAFVVTLCNALKLITGDGGKAFAAFAIVSLGIGFFTGKVSWGLMIGVAAGIAAMFGAPTIVAAISGTDQLDCEVDLYTG